MWNSGEEHSQFALTSRKNVGSFIKLKTVDSEKAYDSRQSAVAQQLKTDLVLDFPLRVSPRIGYPGWGFCNVHSTLCGWCLTNFCRISLFRVFATLHPEIHKHLKLIIKHPTNSISLWFKTVWPKPSLSWRTTSKTVCKLLYRNKSTSHSLHV